MSSDDYDSGPYCKHWRDPSSCEECAVTTVRENVNYLSEEVLQQLVDEVNAEIKKRKESA